MGFGITSNPKKKFKSVILAPVDFYLDMLRIFFQLGVCIQGCSLLATTLVNTILESV